jgi:hypothetical protein
VRSGWRRTRRHRPWVQIPTADTIRLSVSSVDAARATTSVRDEDDERGWSIEAWRFISTESARALARTPAFCATWRALVVRLVRLGDLSEQYLELRGEQVDQFLATPSAPLDRRDAESAQPTAVPVG